MNREPTLPLSPAGAARRDEILRRATEAMAERGRARRRRRRAAALALVALPAAALALLRAPTAPAPARIVADATPAPAMDLATDLVRVATPAGILDRYRAAPPPAVVVIDDRGLVETLREIDRPAGVIRIDGRALLTAAVTD